MPLLFTPYPSGRQRVSPVRRRPSVRIGSLLLSLVLAHLLALPCAAPFAAGSSPHSAVTQHAALPRNNAAARTMRHMAATGGEASSSTTDSKKKPPFGSWFMFSNNDNNNNHHNPHHSSWKDGEQSASLVSRLLFQYASPLLTIATKRRLEANDSIQVAPHRKMQQTVTSLERLYEHVQAMEAKKKKHHEPTSSATSIAKQDRTNSKSTDTTDTDQQAYMLTKALVMHQRRMLITTGVLRFINTAVQAFPAIYIARLLRLVEAGTAVPLHKALSTAVALVGILTLKMVMENQYFHQVIQCAMQVRGALAGLLFDKSLRLPSGGGDGVLDETNNNNNNAGGAGADSLLSKTVAATNTTTESSLSSSLGAGAVLNLMQSDASIIENAAMQVHTLWDGPLQIAIYTSLLFRYLGPSVWWGIAVLLITIPVNSIALRILNHLAKYENEAKDARTKRTAESIQNMKLLKLQGWEQRFANDIRSHRREELRRHVSRGVIRALNAAISNAVPSLVLVVTLTAYMKTGKPIVASTIFTAISLFNQLRFPLFFYPMLIDALANGRNAMRRIATYLASEEIVPYVRHLPPLEEDDTTMNSGSGGGGSIELKHGNFLWTTAPRSSDGKAAVSAAPALASVELKVNPGEVVAVVGSVGSGKSCLIKALLGELNPVPGMVVQQAISNDDDFDNVRPDDSTSDPNGATTFEKPVVITHGNVAYCSQEAWLPKGTIKDAILFGREYDEARYMAAIRDAGLDKDIVDSLNGANSKSAASSGVLSHDTDVGEGGSSLSGGQRARVALARALYSGDDTKVFLLDDCLAALDASVGSTVFERLTRRLRQSNAAAVLVTNDPSIPRRCDRVVLMGNVPQSSSCSTIVDIGTYDELIARGHNLRSISSIEDGPEDGIGEYETSELSSTTTHSAYAHAPKLTRIRGDKIKVVGGFDNVCNSTDVSCHPDIECQATMEKCPDYVAVGNDPTISARSTKIQDEDDILVDLYKANNTFDEPVQNSGLGSKATSATSGGSVDTKLSSADDAMSVGAVPRSTYISYLKSVRQPLLVFAMLSCYLLSNGAQFFQQYTVAKWTEVGADGALAAALNLKYMHKLVQAAGVVSVTLWLRSFLTMKVGIRASEHLHSQMLSSVFRAPMSFFDATPSGQLLSRFGKEIETIDRAVPDSISSVLFCFLQIFMSVGALAGVITPTMALPIFVVGIFYNKAMTLFRAASRDLKRAETKTRSPIYTHFGEALRGTDTIRSVPGARQYWSEQHRSLTDTNLGVFYTLKALDRWLSTRLETLGNTVVLTAAVASVFLTRAGRLQSGSAGWGLTQALSITGLLTWAVRTLTELESNMMSVMRVKELTNVEQEQISGNSKTTRIPREAIKAGEALAPLLSQEPTFNATLAPLDSSALIKSGWPWRGNISFKDVSMRYNPSSPLVLQGVNLAVPAATTLGVVGRTGSGKSSLLLTLFRIAEIERDGGSIEIDGVDIRSVELEQLRQSLAIIPQDPVLFAGTIGYNLDATGRASPEEMWAALHAASPSLAQQFQRTKGLDSQIIEGGKNLSLGQRQLICLARALLRKSKVLVLDEATSSVDPRTDQEVQDTIRREFVNKGVTVITVAHRLDTVLGYDKIAVLGSGSVLEYGAPAALLRIPGGELRRLVEADKRNKQKGAAASRGKETVVAG